MIAQKLKKKNDNAHYNDHTKKPDSLRMWSAAQLV